MPMGERVAGRLFNNEGALSSPAHEGVSVPTLTFRHAHMVCSQCDTSSCGPSCADESNPMLDLKQIHMFANK